MFRALHTCVSSFPRPSCPVAASSVAEGLFSPVGACTSEHHRTGGGPRRRVTWLTAMTAAIATGISVWLWRDGSCVEMHVLFLWEKVDLHSSISTFISYCSICYSLWHKPLLCCDIHFAIGCLREAWDLLSLLWLAGSRLYVLRCAVRWTLHYSCSFDVST